MVRTELVQEILQLDPSDQEYVVDLLLSRLADTSPNELTPEEQSELTRRADEFKTHPENFLSWDQVKALLHAQRQKAKK